MLLIPLGNQLANNQEMPKTVTWEVQITSPQPTKFITIRKSQDSDPENVVIPFKVNAWYFQGANTLPGNAFQAKLLHRMS